MCGIFCEILYSPSTPKVIEDEKIKNRIRNRGPDNVCTIHHLINYNLSIYFYGSVLWMRGKELTKQPVENERGILLFNGDIFDETWNTQIQSDTQIVMDKLTKDDTSETIICEIKKLKGPFSLVYYNKLTECLYFTRDKIGRNTLLIYNSGHSTVISSVLGKQYASAEIPATCIHKLDLKSNNITQFTWEKDVENTYVYSLKDWLQVVYKQQNLPDEDFAFKLDDSEYMCNMEVIKKDNIIALIEKISQCDTEKHIILKNLLQNPVILETVKKLKELLEKSVLIRLETQPLRCKNCITDKFQGAACCHSATGVLFSGGLDCTILALLADKFVPKNQSIDLLNVAFETKKNKLFEVPDRLTGRQSYEELKNICPNRDWIFREVNVTLEDLETCKSEVIGDLIYPRKTILDESLGSALWFASRGQDNEDVSPCRVLLVGSGADELFGGYMRHRTALKRHGWVGLSKELLLDWKRISFRNLARDNRVICDHGRQPRMPYLDEDFVDFVINLKPWLRCFPSADLDVGIGDKLFLRLVAMDIGLHNAAMLPKRAIQFGSRIANSKQKGSDISETFKE